LRIVEYTPEHFDLLQRFARRIQPTGLLHRPFVDYYYAASDWCKLNMLLRNDGAVVATMGVDRMRFEFLSREMALGFASNFYTVEPGAGGYLFMYWMRTCPAGLVFGSSEDMQRILRKRKWAPFDIRTYYLNPPYKASQGEPWWRMLAKPTLRYLRQRKVSKCASRIPPDAIAGLSVREEPELAENLLPRKSPYSFRFAPPLDYLRWRYKSGLSFVHYRLFRVFASGATIGYVILNESDEQVMVAQCDGEDPVALAYGVLLSILEVVQNDIEPRTVFLTCCHREMQKIYERFGFRASRTGVSFVPGNLHGPIDLSSDTANWLINYDWGDNGLIAPFPDQAPERPSAAAS
jgi:hypothetical protein